MKLTHNKDTDNTLTSLAFLGWNAHFQKRFTQNSSGSARPSRVTGVHKNSFLVHQGAKEKLVTVSGKISQNRTALFPVVGDWVLVKDKIICDVMPRQNALSRGAAGSSGKLSPHSGSEQVIAANLDTVFIVCGTDRDFNIRRIERYLTLVYNCGLNPVIILTKADLHQHPEKFADEVESIAFGVPVHLISASDSHGLTTLEPYLSEGQTITMIGSSGAGKSTLVNRLYGRTVQNTRSVSESIGKGRHTTTSRNLILMPQGGMIIDNPGIREIGFWDDQEGLYAAFPEIEKHAGTCRFRNCTHTREPGCQVLHAVSIGEIQQDRLENYHKMKRELAYLTDRRQKSADRLEKERWKGVSLKIKAMKKRGL